MAKEELDELKIMVLDNEAFHKAKTLIIPDNIVLLFLLPYGLELNAAEKMLAKFKRTFTNRLFHSLERLKKFIYKEAKKENENVLKSIFVIAIFWLFGKVSGIAFLFFCLPAFVPSLNFIGRVYPPQEGSIQQYIIAHL